MKLIGVTWAPDRLTRLHPGGVEDASAPKGSLTQLVGDAGMSGQGANATAPASSLSEQEKPLDRNTKVK